MEELRSTHEMSYEEMIDTLKGLVFGIFNRTTAKEREALDIAIKALEQTKWISVSERLPEDRNLVLVTAYWHETYQVMMASYFGDGLWWCVPFNNCGKHMQRLKPKAWMPLPKPYKADNKNKQGLAYADQDTLMAAT